jgi:hypothetical protein
MEQGDGEEGGRKVKESSESLFDASLRVHVNEIVEYIIRGSGRRRVPNAIYRAAWEIKYAFKHTSKAKDEVAV